MSNDFADYILRQSNKMSESELFDFLFPGICEKQIRDEIRKNPDIYYFRPFGLGDFVSVLNEKSFPNDRIQLYGSVLTTFIYGDRSLYHNRCFNYFHCLYLHCGAFGYQGNPSFGEVLIRLLEENLDQDKCFLESFFLFLCLIYSRGTSLDSDELFLLSWSLVLLDSVACSENIHSSSLWTMKEAGSNSSLDIIPDINSRVRRILEHDRIPSSASRLLARIWAEKSGI